MGSGRATTLAQPLINPALTLAGGSHPTASDCMNCGAGARSARAACPPRGWRLRPAIGSSRVARVTWPRHRARRESPHALTGICSRRPGPGSTYHRRLIACQVTRLSTARRVSERGLTTRAYSRQLEPPNVPRLSGAATDEHACLARARERPRARQGWGLYSHESAALRRRSSIDPGRVAGCAGPCAGGGTSTASEDDGRG